MVWTNAPYTTVGGGRRGKRNRRREEERSLENRWRAGPKEEKKRRTNNHTHALFLSFHREAEEEGAGLCASARFPELFFWKSDSGFPNSVTTFHKGGNRDLVTSPFVIYPLFWEGKGGVRKIFGKFFRGVTSDQHRSENQDLHRFFLVQGVIVIYLPLSGVSRKKESGKKRKFRVGRNIWIGGGDTVSFGLFSFFIFLFGPNPIFSFLYIRGGRRRREKGQRHCDQKQSFPTHTRFRAKKKIKGKKGTKKGKMWGVRSTKIRKEFGGNKRKRWTEGKTFPFSLTPISRMAGQEKSTWKGKFRLLPSLIGRTSTLWFFSHEISLKKWRQKKQPKKFLQVFFSFSFPFMTHVASGPTGEEEAPCKKDLEEREKRRP